MSFILTKNAGVPVKYLIEGYVEQDTDRAQLRTDYTLGSKIKVIETGKSYVLTENGWKYLEESSFDPSVLDDYYTKEETDELIATLNSFVYVDTLPTENIKTNVIYLVPAEDPGDDDVKDEYLNLDGTSAGWERIGSTKIDLTQYYTKTETDAKFVEKEAGKGLSTNDYTTVEKQKLAGLDASDFATAAQGVKADNAEIKNTEQDGRLDTLEDEIIVTKTISGDFLHITDAAAYPAEECVTTLEPVQDLHGYSKPWPAGGGKNLLPITAESQTINGVTFTVNKDSAGNVVSVTVNGTATANAFFRLGDVFNYLENQTYSMNGCPNGGSGESYYWTIQGSSVYYDTGSGSTFTIPTGFTLERVEIVIANGYTANNLVFKPMIRLATDTDPTFEPYSNECPISGHTGVELTRTGKNLLPFFTEVKQDRGCTVQPLSNGRYDFYGTATGNIAILYSITDLKLDGVYRFVADSYVTQSRSSITLYYHNKSGGSVSALYPNDTIDLSINEIISIAFYAATDVTIDYRNIGLMLIPSTEADATFEPYTPETHSQTFPQAQSPVYGCEVDWINGVLRVDRVKVTKLWGDSQYKTTIGTVERKEISLPFSAVYPPTAGKPQLCSIAPYKANYFEDSVHFYINANSINQLILFLPVGTSDDTEIEVSYELATPLEIPLTPQIITLLKGENNVWLDAGTFEKFEYYPDSTIGEQIGELDKRVTDLENQEAPAYWEGTRAEYEALTEPLPEGTYVYLKGESVDYNELDNLPKINNIELAGNKSASDLGLATPQDIADAIAAIVDYESEVFPNG